MAHTRIPASTLRRYLFGGQVSNVGCLAARSPLNTTAYLQRSRRLHTDEADLFLDPEVPFRKQLKEEGKQRKAQSKRLKSSNQSLEDWELTIGIEIHAQLNTTRKLFSSAASTINAIPNTHVALFDVAMPGSQPIFQKETLIPAIRAAIALNCNIQKESRFDRKHYFHWDQPAGYQITQYYKPFAKDGYVTLYAHDGIAKEDGEEVRIGIKQVQMEQDTAKTSTELEGEHLIDFNRAGLPLIEIITLPQIHHPQTAAALVRKIQILLGSVDACVLGMQNGGLRADVNVSVRRRGDVLEGNEYGGVKGLGTRTEIKNLSSFKAVEDAIIVERDRQIEVLEAGGVIEGETRGWTIGGTETKRLRGKEGEVDYRYMPDPDIRPIIIGDDLVGHLKATMGILPDAEIRLLVDEYGLTTKDAMSLVSLENGGRVEYFWKVFDKLHATLPDQEQSRIGRLVGNWVLHELGGLVSGEAFKGEDALQITPDGNCIIPDDCLADLLFSLDTNKITGKTAKNLLKRLFDDGQLGKRTVVDDIIEAEGWWFSPLSDREYEDLARTIWDQRVVAEILAGKEGKINFLVGKMMRGDQDGRVQPLEATKVLKRLIEEQRK